MIKKYETDSRQMKFEYNDEHKVFQIEQGDMDKVDKVEYFKFMEIIGEQMKSFQAGKVLLDTRYLKNYSLEKRSFAVNNAKKLLFDKAPFFVIAVVKGPNLFENSALQISVKLASKLSKKFLAGESFNDYESALNWLKDYEVPIEYKPKTFS